MKKKFDVEGMVCSSCQATVAHAVKDLKGVKNVDVSLIDNSMIVDYNERRIGDSKIIEAVTKAGYGASVSENRSYEDMLEEKREKRRKKKVRLIATLILAILLMIFAMVPMIVMENGGVFITDDPLILISIQLVLLIPIIAINPDYFTSGFKALFTLHPNMNSLVAIGSSASTIYGLYSYIKIIVLTIMDKTAYMEEIHALGMNLYLESAGTIIALVSLGKYLETLSIDSTLEAIGSLMKLAPDEANVIRDGIETKTRVSGICIGDRIIIRPGERIPLDGRLVEGHGSIDESTLTGESLPCEKEIGDEALSGTLNVDGSFVMEITKIGKDTTLNKVVELVREASTYKTKMTKLVDTISFYFVPTVMVISLITFITWASIPPHDIQLAFNFAISVLVISCPCALGLATPIATLIGAKKGAQNGILIRSSEGFEQLHDISCFIFDKTGTLTEGRMKVVRVDVEDGELPNLLALESLSTHPLSKGISSYLKEKDISANEATNFKMTPGLGIEADIEGHHYKSGNSKFINFDDTYDKSKSLIDEGCLVTYISKDEKFMGFYAMKDNPKESSRRAVEELQKMGKRVILLSGDNERTARHLAATVGIDEVEGNLKPEGKLRRIEELQGQGLKVAMVGDGINDSPSLARADVGMAIGAGSDIAIDSADVVLIRDDLMDVISAIRLSRKVHTNIKANIFWAFFYNAVAIPFAAGALYFPPLYFSLNPMIASLCMAASSISVVLNALRLNLFKKQ